MPISNEYKFVIEQVAPRPLAIVRAQLPAAQVPARFRSYLDQVYAAARAGAVELDGQNIFIYRDVPGVPDMLEVEFGVGVNRPFAATGNVVHSMTPSGDAATTTHLGDYRDLRNAHASLVDWCRTCGLTLAGPRWEVYGHWREGVIPRTDIYYLIASR